ncbi:MAG: redoxin domain-containing protein [Actinomycetales bacterium]|nr:redoxin domain-containing protein [Actinomycetales bacterium]
MAAPSPAARPAARPRVRIAGAAIALTLLALGPALAGCSSSSQADQANAGTGFVAGDGSIVVLPESERVPAPEIEGVTLGGDTFRLSEHRGKPVVINVWASWCAPCRAEAPSLAKAARELGDTVQFVGLDTRDSDDTARSFVAKFGIPYPNVIDRDGQLQLLFGDSLPPQAIPSTVVIDPQGRVAARALGRVSESSLLGMVDMAQSPSGTPS